MFRLPLAADLAARLPAKGDAERLFALIDADRAHLGARLDWVDGTRGPDDVRTFLEGSLANFAAGRGFDALLEADGAPVGMLGVHDVHARPARAAVGYWLASARQGEGLITRAVAGLLPHLFGAMELERVEIRCDPANARSRAVPERLGFTNEGTLRRVERVGDRSIDHVVYGLLRDEWRAGPDRGPEETPA